MHHGYHESFSAWYNIAGITAIEYLSKFGNISPLLYSYKEELADNINNPVNWGKQLVHLDHSILLESETLWKELVELFNLTKEESYTRKILFLHYTEETVDLENLVYRIQDLEPSKLYPSKTVIIVVPKNFTK